MNRIDLLSTMESLTPGLSKKERVEHAQSFIFTGTAVLTYNDEISVQKPLVTEFQGAIPSAPLLNFLKRATGEEVTIEAKEAEIVFKCGRVRAGIPLLASVPEHLTSLKIPAKGWQMVSEGLLNAIKFCSFCVSSDMSSPLFTCIHVSGRQIEAGDNYRFTRYEIKEDYPTFLLPGSTVKELLAFTPTEIRLTDSWVHFRNMDKAIFSRRLQAGTYKDIGPFLEDFKGTAITFPEQLKAALERTGAFAVADFDQDRQVRLTAKGGRLIARAEGADGWCEETLAIEGKPEFVIGIHPNLLQEILSHTRTAIFGSGKLLFIEKNFRHVLAC